MISTQIRAFLRSWVLDCLGSFSKPAPGIHILNGHRIQEEPEPDTFRHLLNELSQYAEFIKIEDAVQGIIHHEQPDKPLIAFTFDDGFMEIDHFNKNIVMTPNKRPMRWEQLKELSERGHIIGAHTMDHYMINTDNKETLKHQVCDCKRAIEANIGKACDYFAFPYGKLTHANQLSIDIACQQYKYVFSQSDYKHYFSFGNRVINRRHFEPFWPHRHVFYFLSCHKTY